MGVIIARVRKSKGHIKELVVMIDGRRVDNRVNDDVSETASISQRTRLYTDGTSKLTLPLSILNGFVSD